MGEGVSVIKGDVSMTNEITSNIINRLKSIKGHVQGVEKMVKDEAYCIDILNQINAIQAALKKVSALVLDRHLHTCFTTAIRANDPGEQERVIDEIMGLFTAKGKN
jgi:DNA-binding FrmR family transcriptional regulator